MPIPVSQISMLSFPSRRRQPSSTLPRLVYFTALESRLRIICSSRRGSLWTERPHGTTRSARRLACCVIGEFVPQPDEQIVDRETDEVGADGARLDLVDVEQRVQHARHRGQRFVEPPDKLLGLLSLDRLGQQPLNQGQRLQRLAEVMARGGKKARFCQIGQFRLPLGRLQRIGGAPALGDVGKGDDDAFDRVVLGAVRQDATDVPEAGPGSDLALDRREGLQHRPGVGQQARRRSSAD